jgi:hypothetical protein
MHFKNSFVLFTALTAGSAVARLHGHERRHVHHARHEDVDKRGVGDMVYATINGVLVSWVQQWSPHEATATPASPASTPASTPAEAEVSVASVDATPTPSPSIDSPSSAPSDWASFPANGEFTREGFGKQSGGASGKGIFYTGNVGDPWGSNIIQVPGTKASQYKYVIKFDAHTSEPWTVVFWNKIGPDGQLTGWYGNSALTFTVAPGESKFVALDDNSQGGWGAAAGELPTDKFGGYASTWGEFDFGSDINGGFSGWDVSAIKAQAAGMEVQGMKICHHTGDKCSTITPSASMVDNAYTLDLAGIGGIGGKTSKGPVRLQADVGFDQ